MKERKSPQQKKELEYTRDHFTFGWNSSRMFPKAWKLKKARVNRQYRRKSELLLAPTKAGIAADDVELGADDLTAARFQKSVVRKGLHKTGTVTLGEKVQQKLKRRREAVGRNVQRHQHYDRAATSAIKTLHSLDSERFADVVRQADLLCGARNADELKRVLNLMILSIRPCIFYIAQPLGPHLNAMPLGGIRSWKGIWGFGSRKQCEFSTATSAGRKENLTKRMRHQRS